MKKAFGKKQWMMLGLVVALGAAVYLNYYFTQDIPLSQGEQGVVNDTDDGALGDALFVGAPVEDEQPKEETPKGESPSATADYFAEARAARTDAREESVKLLEEVFDSAGSTAEEKAAATAKATAIADHILQESNIENLIIAKGFADCVVFIHDDACRVVVDVAELQAMESVQIMEIVLSQSDIVADNVQIVTRAN